ncbi:MAG TPA: alpha/beta fold hydrolase [Terriglobales bacterium]
MQLAQSDDGTSITYETHGSGGLKLILLHGWGGSSSYWRDLVSHLNLKGLPIIAPSYRGHGDSDKPVTGYTLDGFAKDVLAVADAVGAQRFVLVGFSMSGKFAQYITALNPTCTWTRAHRPCSSQRVSGSCRRRESVVRHPA